MAFEWVAGLFQSDNQQTRGLSGDQAHSVALDDSNPYYNFRLRRHKAEGDLIADPGLLWYTSPYVKRRSGLGTHVSADVGEGNSANYTDILLVLSRDDYARAKEDWHQNAARALQQEFDNFCRRENYSRLHAHRPLGVRVVEDGSAAMGGVSLGLLRGEFVTGILPNLYTGPVRGSYPVIAVHVNLPGVWDGYQEVGRLYNDQSLFTLGNHWLDNFSHPSLQQAALYRLRQYPDGSFVHIINPDLQDQYQVTSTNQGGASVLTLATRSGQPLAYMVLAVIDPPSARPSTKPEAGTRPDSGRPAEPRTDAPRSDVRPDSRGRPAIPSIPEPRQPEAKPQPAGQQRPNIQLPRPKDLPSIAPPMMVDDIGGGSALGGKTIIPDMPQERVFTLQERGALLQKVHFANFMLGYDVYFGTRGELGTHVENPAATFQVRRRSVSLVAHVDGVVVGGRPVPPGVEVPIEGDVKIEVAGQRMEYFDLRGLQVDGWPYVGEIRRPASSTYMIWGEDYQIGRSRECRVVLPDEPRNDNIHWKPAIGDGATIRARSGEIPKSRFYTDSIMVASEHAGIDLRGPMPKILCTARYCYVYIRRNGNVFPMFPATSPQQPKELDLLPGDEILIGNCLFYAGFTASDSASPTAAPLAPAVDADLLASSVDRPNLQRLDARSVPPIGVERASDPRSDAGPEDLPSAGGTPPSPPPRQAVGLDSLLLDHTPSGHSALGTGGPIDIGDEDEPTVPGLMMPRDHLDSLLGLSVDTSIGVGGSAGTPIIPPLLEPASIPDDPSVDSPQYGGVRGQNRPAGQITADWDEDEDSILSASAPPDPDGANAATETTVPTPFPDMLKTPASVSGDLAPAAPELEPARATWPPDGDLYTPPASFSPAPAAERGPAPDETPLSAPFSWLEPASSAPPASEDPPAVSPVAEVEPPLAELEPPPAEVEPPPAEVEPPPAEVEPIAEVEPPPVEVVPPPLPVAQVPPPLPPEATPAPAPSRAPTGAAAAGAVVATDDAEAQFELGRPMHLVLVGWTVNGEVTVGNHDACGLVIPENRIDPDQQFEPRTYLRFKVRGRKGTAEVLAPSEVRVDDGAAGGPYDDPEAHVFDVVRRDDSGEEDFVVRLRVVEDKRLPDPRARLVQLDHSDPLSAALVTRGLPKGAPRTLVIDGLGVTFRFDGAVIHVTDYLATYRRGDGFLPFFVSRAEGRFKTAPEDGAAFELSAGDRLVVGYCVYELRAE
jgi:hypothetical protein